MSFPTRCVPSGFVAIAEARFTADFELISVHTDTGLLVLREDIITFRVPPPAITHPPSANQLPQDLQKELSSSYNLRRKPAAIWINIDMDHSPQGSGRVAVRERCWTRLVASDAFDHMYIYAIHGKNGEMLGFSLMLSKGLWKYQKPVASRGEVVRWERGEGPSGGLDADAALRPGEDRRENDPLACGKQESWRR